MYCGGAVGGEGVGVVDGAVVLEGVVGDDVDGGDRGGGHHLSKVEAYLDCVLLCVRASRASVIRSQNGFISSTFYNYKPK